jgi:hypothetical protein
MPTSCFEQGSPARPLRGIESGRWCSRERRHRLRSLLGDDSRTVAKPALVGDRVRATGSDHAACSSPGQRRPGRGPTAPARLATGSRSTQSNPLSGWERRPASRLDRDGWAPGRPAYAHLPAKRSESQVTRGSRPTRPTVDPLPVSQSREIEFLAAGHSAHRRHVRRGRTARRHIQDKQAGARGRSCTIGAGLSSSARLIAAYYRGRTGRNQKRSQCASPRSTSSARDMRSRGCATA